MGRKRKSHVGDKRRTSPSTESCVCAFHEHRQSRVDPSRCKCHTVASIYSTVHRDPKAAQPPLRRTTLRDIEDGLPQFSFFFLSLGVLSLNFVGVFEADGWHRAAGPRPKAPQQHLARETSLLGLTQGPTTLRGLHVASGRHHFKTKSSSLVQSQRKTQSMKLGSNGRGRRAQPRPSPCAETAEPRPKVQTILG